MEATNSFRVFLLTRASSYCVPWYCTKLVVHKFELTHHIWYWWEKISKTRSCISFSYWLVVQIIIMVRITCKCRSSDSPINCWNNNECKKVLLQQPKEMEFVLCFNITNLYHVSLLLTWCVRDICSRYSQCRKIIKWLLKKIIVYIHNQCLYIYVFFKRTITFISLYVHQISIGFLWGSNSTNTFLSHPSFISLL